METATPPPVDPTNLPGQAPKWPKILGIIALVLGILGTLQCAVAPFSLFFVESQMKLLVEQGADEAEVNSYLDQIKSLSTLSAILLGSLAVLLLVGGILLLKRKPKAPLILQIWAVLKMLCGGYFSFQQMSLTRLQMDITMGTNGMGSAKEAEMVQKITDYAMTGGFIFGLLWLCALPIFFLIWFNRSAVKEEIAKW